MKQRRSRRMDIVKATLLYMLFAIPGFLFILTDSSLMDGLGIEMVGAGISFYLVFIFFDMYRMGGQDLTVAETVPAPPTIVEPAPQPAGFQLSRLNIGLLLVNLVLLLFGLLFWRGRH